MTVERWASARSAAAAATPSISATINSSARRATSIDAVSSTSWLVAPKWAWLDASLSALASGTTGVAELTAARPSSARSKRAGSHATAISSAASCGITPARASTTASAASKRSIAAR